MNYKLVFGLVALLLFASILGVALIRFSQPFYPSWLIGLGLTTLFLYWLDKRLAQSDSLGLRVPELVFNLLTLAGGFAGAWAGRYLFRHKINLDRHRGMFIILMLSTLLHGLFICGPTLLRM